MGENFGSVVKYRCFNDCRQDGCPGHAVRFGYSRIVPRVVFFEIDGKKEYWFDANLLKAAIESMNSLRRAASPERKDDDGENVS